MNLKDGIVVGVGIIMIAMVILFFAGLLLYATTNATPIDLTGASWECAKCSMPSALCKTTTNLNYNCTWTCVDETTNKTTYETTSCNKLIMVKYLEATK